MTLVEKIESILEPAAKSRGLAIVQVAHAGRSLQVLLEKENGESPTIDECEAASREFSALLDVEDPMRERYFLDVGSAGMDRPLVKPADFARFVGFDAKIELKLPLGESERRTIKGKIESADGRHVKIGGDEIEFGNISKAKLVTTDERIRKILKERKN
ncbi:MAG: ribosome maturation factor RimP [Rickettsiales bacterium]|jgi:ribosome maturation factor RimP|nr:ribosome maturation factor RimP [Rickettsiales bacterium]